MASPHPFGLRGKPWTSLALLKTRLTRGVIIPLILLSLWQVVKFSVVILPLALTWSYSFVWVRNAGLSERLPVKGARANHRDGRRHQ